MIVVPTPSGAPFTQQLAVELSAKPWLVFTPARYEGIDRRVIEEYGDRVDVREVSIGDYVLAGGEAPVLVMVEAVARLLPGVLGNAESHQDDSFAPGADGRPPGGPRLHQAARVAGPRHPRGAAQRPPRQDRPLAPRPGPPPAPTANRPDLIARCDPAVARQARPRDPGGVSAGRRARTADFGRTAGAVEE